MKRIIAVLLSALLLISASSLTVFAENGPSDINWEGDYWAFIRIYDGKDKNYSVFSQNTADNSAIAGATYDRASNTLTLSDFKHPELNLSTNMMGDDFKLKIEGECELGVIYIWGDMYGGSLDIEGSGTLTVNADKKKITALVMNAEGSKAKLNFGKDVKVKLYASENAAEISMSDYRDTATGITFANGKTYPVKAAKETYKDIDFIDVIEVEEKYEGETDIGIKAKCASDPDGIYSVFIDSDDCYYIKKSFFLEEYGAIVQDFSFGEKRMTKEEFEESDYSIVTENRPKEIYYSDEWLEKNYRGEEGDRLRKKSDPDDVYAVNYGWITDREHPTDYFIRHLIWDDELEYYVDDPDFEHINMDPEEFADSGYEIIIGEDGEHETIRYIDEYSSIERYGYHDPIVINDKDPDNVYVAQKLELEDPDEDGGYYGGGILWVVTRLDYNEKRGYYLMGDEVADIRDGELEESGFHYVYEDQPVRDVYITRNEVRLYGMELYEDEQGKRYGGISYMNKVYDFSDDNTVEVMGKKYYVPTENNTVDFSDLKPVEIDVETDYKHFTIEGGEFLYNTDSTPVPSTLIGDVNDDGKVNGADAGLLNRYTSGWDGYAEKIKNMDAADINRDGKVNGADSGLLNRYTSGWDTVKKYFTAA